MSSPPSQSDSVRHNIELWLVGEEKLDIHALYDELARRYPDVHSPTNYCALMLAAVMEYETVVPMPPQRDTVSLPDVDHLDCTDKVPCGPQCPRWEVALSDAQVEQMRELGRNAVRRHGPALRRLADDEPDGSGPHGF